MTPEMKKRQDRIPSEIKRLGLEDTVVHQAITAYLMGNIEYVPMLEACVRSLVWERTRLLATVLRLAERSPMPFILEGVS